MIYIDTSGYDDLVQLKDDQKTVKEIYYERVRGMYPNDLLPHLKSFLVSNFDEDLFANLSDEETLKELVLMSAESLKKLNFTGDSKALSKVIRGIADRKKQGEYILPILDAIYELREIYTQTDGIMQRSAVSRQITKQMNMFLIEKLGVLVCPYCNRNFINNRGERFAAQIDHFYDKDHFPWFSVSLYNFIPSCASCNHIKGAHHFQIHPFIESQNQENAVTFRFIQNDIDEYEVGIETTDLRKQDLDTIYLEQTYAIHSLDVRNMLDREVRYSDSYREELRNLFQQEGDFSWILTDDEIDRMIYGDSIFEEDIKNIPLGKFRKDIYEEIKRLR